MKDHNIICIDKYFGFFKAFMAILVMLSFMSCNFYKVVPVIDPTPEELNSLILQNKVFILHIGNDKYLLKNIKIKKDHLTGDLRPVPVYHDHSKNTNTKGFNRYRKNERQVLSEVHLYLNEYTLTEKEKILIPYNSLSVMEVYEKELNSTITSHVIAINIIMTAVISTIALIFLLSRG